MSATTPDGTTSDDAVAPVRIGFLGAGLIAAYHAVQLNLAGESNRIVAVHDPDADRARALAQGQGAEVAGGPEEVVASSDAVFVCTWTAAHERAVELAAAAGVPVFCEKPLSVDLASARRVAAAGAAVPTMVGLVLRSTPAFLGLRELLSEPEVGRVMNVVFRDDQYLPTQGMYASTWRGEIDKCGAGALLEHSIHDLDILEWLLGPVESVAAQQGHFHGLDGIEDTVSVLLRFAGGTIGTLSSVWHDVLSRPSQRRLEIFCERATLTLEGDVVGPLRRQTTDGELVLEGDELVAWLRERGVATDSAEEQFVRAVRHRRDGGEPGRLDPDVEDALRAHVLADAVYRSAAGDGDAVFVPVPADRSPAGT